jgi:hypothetical protein
MVYNWDDLEEFRERPIEVEWGANIHPTRRARALEPRNQEQKRNNYISNAVVISSLIVAVTMVSFMSLALMKAPTREVDASKSVGLTPQTPAPSMKPSPQYVHPSSSPTDERSERPSNAASGYPSAYPSKLSTEFPTSTAKAPPSPTAPLCIDRVGFFYNHAGDKVSCDWFQSVGSHNYHRNCGQTDVGKACLLSCKQYTDCVMPTDSPTDVPSASPTSPPPTSNPTPEPPKSMTIYPTGDAMIKQSSPQANYGSASWLKVDTDSGVFHSLLRFDVSEHNSNRTVESAMLRLKAASDCPSGGYLQRTQHPHWDEMSITWESAPEGDGNEVARFLEPIRSGFWYSVDVKSSLRPGHNTLSLRLYPVSSDECIFASKENGSSESPVLRIVYA